jgi:hypothetical protein
MSGRWGYVRTVAQRRLPKVLFVGAGISQTDAITRIRATGVRVLAIDEDERAPGLREADVPVVPDIPDVKAVVELAVANAVDGVMTVAADRAVPERPGSAASHGGPSVASRDSSRDRSAPWELLTRRQGFTCPRHLAIIVTWRDIG